jgi:hypothetical protein
MSVSATRYHLLQRSPIECGASVRDLDTSTMRQPEPEYGCCAIKKDRMWAERETETSYFLFVYLFVVRFPVGAMYFLFSIVQSGVGNHPAFYSRGSGAK